jgi:hypothetical protein
MSCGSLQCVRKSLCLGKIGGTPVEIDHALILCRFVGLGRRSAQQLSFERSKLISLPEPDHHREIWKTRHPSHGLLAYPLAQAVLDTSQRTRLSMAPLLQIAGKSTGQNRGSRTNQLDQIHSEPASRRRHRWWAQNLPRPRQQIRETVRGLGSRARSHRAHQQGVSPRSSLSEPTRAGESSPPAVRIRSAWYRSHRIPRLSPFPAHRLVRERTER